MSKSTVLSDTDIEVKVTDKVGKSNVPNLKISIRIRLLAASTTATTVNVEKGFDDLVVYTSPLALGGLERIGASDECLYLTGPNASGELPPLPADQGYVAVDLLNARTNQETLNLRGIIQTAIQAHKTNGPLGGGIGPVSSHP